VPPSKITDELIDQICNHIREGNYVESSCFACGIAKRTYYNWVKRGEEDTEKEVDSVYSVFYNRLQEAYGQAEVELVRRINSEDERNWQRLPWILERTRQRRFGQRQQVDVDIDQRVHIGLPDPPKTHEEWLQRRAERKRIARQEEST